MYEQLVSKEEDLWGFIGLNQKASLDFSAFHFE
jgi:hypothetical protein